MDTRLRKLVVDAIVRRWVRGERNIPSHRLFAEIVVAGARPAEGAMARVFANLELRGLIRTVQTTDQESVKKDGGRTITWVSPAVLWGTETEVEP